MNLPTRRTAAVLIALASLLAAPGSRVFGASPLPPTARARLGEPGGKGHTARVSAVAWAPDGKTLATGSWDNTVRLWDAATGEELRKMAGHTACIFYVAFSPDGKLLASASRDKTVRLWDPGTGKELRRLVGHTQDVFGAVFSPDGKFLASSGEDKVARLWEVATGKQVRTFQGLGDRVTTVLFTRDGKRLATGCHNGLVALWDVATGKEVRRFVGHTGWVYPITLAPDERTLASGSQDGTIRLWEVATGKERLRITGQGDVFALAYSTDGRTLASASGRGPEVRLWESATGRPRGELKGHTGSIFRLAFSPDGRSLASGSDDTTALVWDLTRLPGGTRPRAEVLKGPELEGLWGDLAGTDAKRAYRAVLRLAGSPEQAVPFLAGRLKSVPEGKPPPIALLIAQLDADDFLVRERATEQLEKIGRRAVPALRRALEGKPSLEQRRRIEALLRKLGGDGPTGAGLRQLRVVEVLEKAGTPAARKVLETLAKEDPKGETGREARAALTRLGG
jgi:tricorn protease-like protein